MPIFRQTSMAGMPLSTCLSAYAICSSLYRDRFIASPLGDRRQRNTQLRNGPVSREDVTILPFSGEREKERSDRPMRPTATAGDPASVGPASRRETKRPRLSGLKGAGTPGLVSVDAETFQRR